MKPSALVVSLGLGLSNVAVAGGLILPGAGAVSTSRAGTGVASTEGGEALSINPAGMAKTSGTTITIGAAIIGYSMSFQRNGTYDDDPNHAEPYEGQRYPVVENNAKPPLGIGSYQPIPAIAVTSDFGGAVPGLVGAIGLFTMNAYPFRDMNYGGYFVTAKGGAYDIPMTGTPPPTRYDVIDQEAAIIMPSIGVAYRVLPDLDIGGRFSLGFGQLNSSVAVWSESANYLEYVKKDGIIHVEANNSLAPAWALGATYRVGPAIELGAQYIAQVNLHAKGKAWSTIGPEATLAGDPIVLTPAADPICGDGGGSVADGFDACIDFALPMQATIGGRYKFQDGAGKTLGDIELNLEWQNWSAERASNFEVAVDGHASTAAAPEGGFDLKKTIIKHGLRDTYGVLVGGSWNFPMGDNTLIARGGIGHETAAAKEHWERVDLDGAARTLFTAGASYKLARVQIDGGFGFVYEGTRTDDRTCNPPLQMPPYAGCGPSGELQPIDQREGPDPQNPVLIPENQLENPVNQGTYKSHYLMFMLGVSTWF